MDLVASNKMNPEFWGEQTRFMSVEHADLNSKEPSVTFKLKTDISMANPSKVAVHGGCVMTILDNATGWAMFAWPQFWEEATEVKHGFKQMMKNVGPSRNLNCTFVRPVPVGEDIFIECKIRSNSKRYCFVTMEMRDSKGTLLTIGTHELAKVVAKV